MAAKPKPEERPAPADARKPATRVRAGALHAALKDVLGVVEARSTIPILSHVRLGAGDGAIELTASDLDIWAVRELASDDRDGPGSQDWIASLRPFALTLPAKALADVLGAVDADAMVTLTAPHDGPGGDGARAVVAVGKARFKLACLPVEEFPLPPAFAAEAGFEMACSQLADAFARVAHAISSDETRYYLNGVNLHTHQVAGEAMVLRLATTDGHRLARLTLDLPEGAASFPNVIVARKTVSVLDKLLAIAAKGDGADRAPASVLVEANGSGKGCLLRFALPAADAGEIEIIAKTIDGDFPDYARVIPADPPLRAVVSRAVLAETVKRVAVLSDRSKAVKAVFADSKLTLSTRCADLGEASEEIEVEYEGPEVTLGYDQTYWREALAALASDAVVMRFAEPPENTSKLPAPARIAAWDGTDEAGALLQVLMPMRV